MNEAGTTKQETDAGGKAPTVDALVKIMGDGEEQWTGEEDRRLQVENYFKGGRYYRRKNKMTQEEKEERERERKLFFPEIDERHVFFGELCLGPNTGNTAPGDAGGRGRDGMPRTDTDVRVHSFMSETSFPKEATAGFGCETDCDEFVNCDSGCLEKIQEYRPRNDKTVRYCRRSEMKSGKTVWKTGRMAVHGSRVTTPDGETYDTENAHDMERYGLDPLLVVYPGKTATNILYYYATRLKCRTEKFFEHAMEVSLENYKKMHEKVIKDIEAVFTTTNAERRLAYNSVVAEDNLTRKAHLPESDTPTPVLEFNGFSFTLDCHKCIVEPPFPDCDNNKICRINTIRDKLDADEKEFLEAVLEEYKRNVVNEGVIAIEGNHDEYMKTNPFRYLLTK